MKWVLWAANVQSKTLDERLSAARAGRYAPAGALLRHSSRLTVDALRLSSAAAARTVLPRSCSRAMTTRSLSGCCGWAGAITAGPVLALGASGLVIAVAELTRGRKFGRGRYCRAQAEARDAVSTSNMPTATSTADRCRVRSHPAGLFMRPARAPGRARAPCLGMVESPSGSGHACPGRARRTSPAQTSCYRPVIRGGPFGARDGRRLAHAAAVCGSAPGPSGVGGGWSSTAGPVPPTACRSRSRSRPIYRQVRPDGPAPRRRGRRRR